MKCSYCEKAIVAGQDSVDFGGEKLHDDCHILLNEEMDENWSDLNLEPDFDEDEEDTSDEGYAFGGQDSGYLYEDYMDYEPNPYDGTYSEE